MSASQIFPTRSKLPLGNNNKPNDFSIDRVMSESVPLLQHKQTFESLSNSNYLSNPEPTLSDKVSYYLPCVSWLPSYNWQFFFGDLVAGLSLASFQMPLSMSYATAIARVPPICGLIGLIIPPMIYAVFGSVPQMIVGPEAALSLIVGTAIEPYTHEKGVDVVDLVIVITSVSGATLLGFGLARFGFLDNVLSTSLLKGFIGGVGLVMLINSSITELGLSEIYENLDPEARSMYHRAPYQKLRFVYRYFPETHKPTAYLCLASLLVLLLIRTVKSWCISRNMNKAVFVPEILIVLLITTVLSWATDWQSMGIKVLGHVNTKHFKFSLPFCGDIVKYYNPLIGAGFSCAILGFFESTTASKSLGSMYNLPISSNRELVALGSINLVGSMFGALPSFGGYGRSKINALSGAKTTIGYNELLTFFVTIIATMFYSIEAGIILGVLYSLVRVVRHSGQSRIQILTRSSTLDTFVNADEPQEQRSDSILDNSSACSAHSNVDGCLIIKIPEPLTFINSSDLKARLRRVELYGSPKIHPATPRLRGENLTRFVIFDLNGMTDLDSTAAQILYDIVHNYKERGICIMFARVPTFKKIRTRLETSKVKQLLVEVANDIRNMTGAEIQGTSKDISNLPYFLTVDEALKAVTEINISSGYYDLSSYLSSLPPY
ncbi:Putative sulfate permease [Komagataella phaffii GS115]|uniref:Sulfate permease n=1 Tax=Komagataella phaffii (strain GS115 / ATCC 20864) TaxID=644223 RepID=C4QXQ5_KOMPG|nr:Putative sulfate permease [Komagataella phaffii GS115]CAY68028.1 Putative sulfate permease [Komagataella phaffii GS115]